MRSVAPALVLGVVAFACDDRGEYGVVVHVPGASSVAARVEVDVVPACAGVPVQTGGDPETTLRHVTVPSGGSQPIGVLAAGSYGLYGRAWDAECRLYASGCLSFRIAAGETGTITLTLAPLDRPIECAGRCVDGSCQPGSRDGGVDAGPDDAGAPTDAGPGVDGSVGTDAGADAGGPDCPGGGVVPGEQTVAIADDRDDAMWNTPWTSPDERLVYRRPDNLALYVGNDAEQQAIGLRFAVDVPRCATIEEAYLGATVFDEVHDLTDTVQVSVWDSVDVPRFNEFHSESPPEHDPAGLWGLSVGDWALNATEGMSLSSPNLAELVQHLVDRDDWQPGATIGFFIEADAMAIDHYLGFVDVSVGDGNQSAFFVRWR